MSERLQKIQNFAARIITDTRKFDHITPVLTDLHWLPVIPRIKYKILCLTFECYNNRSCQYLCCLLHKHQSQLRSGDLKLLKQNSTNNKYGNRAFQHAAPFLWNRLPVGLTCCNSLITFKKQLKTHLFIEYFK